MNATTDIKALRNAVNEMDCLAQGGFTEIATIAKMAMLWLECPDGAKHTDVISQALRMIWNRAEDVENSINYAAEQVGCNWKDGPQTIMASKEGSVHHG